MASPTKIEGVDRLLEDLIAHIIRPVPRRKTLSRERVEIIWRTPKDTYRAPSQKTPVPNGRSKNLCMGVSEHLKARSKIMVRASLNVHPTRVNHCGAPMATGLNGSF